MRSNCILEERHLNQNSLNSWSAALTDSKKAPETDGSWSSSYLAEQIFAKLSVIKINLPEKPQPDNQQDS